MKNTLSHCKGCMSPPVIVGGDMRRAGLQVHKKKKPAVALVYICCSSGRLCTKVEHDGTQVVHKESAQWSPL